MFLTGEHFGLCETRYNSSTGSSRMKVARSQQTGAANDCTSSQSQQINFSDDQAILGLMDIDTDISVYSSEVKNFVQWCDKHHLIFNVKKAEEIIFDPGQPGDHSLLWVHNACITQVYSYKLGVHTATNLSWEVHLNSAFSSIQP